MGAAGVRRGAVGPLLADGHGRDRRTDARAARLYLCVGGAEALGSDVEEAARVAGASPLRVALSVSLPLIMPALLFSACSCFFLGFELFGLPLVLGDPEGHLVLSTYLYKLTNKLGTPSYHLMAAVAVCIVAMTIPLVLLQRRLLQNARKYATIKGKAARMRDRCRSGAGNGSPSR